MSIDDSDFDRLVAGEPFADDASWSDVSAFLDDLRSAYPSGSTAEFEAAHLAAVARESRVVAAGQEPTGANVLSMRRARFRRVLVSSVVGASVLLTAGVGAAAAMGFNPIAQLVAPRIDLPITPTPAPPSVGTPPATDGGRPGSQPSHAPSVPPATTPTPTSTPTEGTTVDPTESPKPAKTEKTKKPKKEKKPKKDKSNNGKSDEAKDKEKTNNGKNP